MKLLSILVVLVIGLTVPVLGLIMVATALFVGGVWVLGWLAERSNGNT